MADKIVLADTSLLIDYFRKTEKSNSALLKLYQKGYDFYISAITEYEIYSGATSLHLLKNSIFILLNLNDNLRITGFPYQSKFITDISICRDTNRGDKITGFPKLSKNSLPVKPGLI